MSSERLSFNQSADGEDDGARWEAYQALLRRTAVPAPESEASPEIDDAFEAADDPLAGPAFDQAPSLRDALETGLAAEDDPPASAARSVTFEPEPSADVATTTDEDADAGLGVWDRPRPAPRTTAPRGRNMRFVGAIMALTAGIILAASLLQPQPVQRDTPPSALAAQARVVAPGSALPPVQPVAPTPPPPTAVQRAVPPVKFAAASAPAAPERVERPAPSAHDCPHCRPDPALQKRPEKPQCWVSSPTLNGEPWLTDCPQIASGSESVAGTPRSLTRP